MACLHCYDTGWVCEAHPDQPYGVDHTSAPVALLPRQRYNAAESGESPPMPEGFEPGEDG